MAIFSYLTLKAPAKAIFKEKGSKFLAFAFPVSSEEQVKERIKELKKKFFDARHQGYAYVLGYSKEKHRAFDDGEPNHSTGDPILGQIRSRDLTNVLVIVVRYFGGVKLGVGGLISAYKTAAGNALSQATVIEKEVVHEFELYFKYESTSVVMRVIKEFDIAILRQDFNEDCKMILQVKASMQESFMQKIELLKALNASLDLVLTRS